MTRFVVCINKSPTHSDPHTRIQRLGTSTSQQVDKASEQWTVDGMIAAIRKGDVFWCSDDRGDLAKVIIASHLGHEYVKTENDKTKKDNLLSKRECNWT